MNPATITEVAVRNLASSHGFDVGTTTPWSPDAADEHHLHLGMPDAHDHVALLNSIALTALCSNWTIHVLSAAEELTWLTGLSQVQRTDVRDHCAAQAWMLTEVQWQRSWERHLVVIPNLRWLQEGPRTPNLLSSAASSEHSPHIVVAGDTDVAAPSPGWRTL